MWRSIKEQARLEVCDLGVYFAVELGLCVTGMFVIFCTHIFGNEKSYFPLGSLIASMGVLCMVLFGNIFAMSMGFDAAVCMGKTRKQYVPAAMIIYFLMTLLLLTGLFVLLRVETGIYGILLPGKIKENIPVLTNFTFPWVIGMSAIMTGYVALGAAVVRQFKIGRIILLAVWLLLCGTLPGSLKGRDSNFLNRFGGEWSAWFAGFQLPVQISILMFAGVLLAGIAYLMFRRQAVQW